MQIRRFRPEDADVLWELVYNTVHKINACDYTQEQVDAWAPQHPDKVWWCRELTDKSPLILHNGNAIYGYADVQKNGHINHFFVAHNCQRQGKGTVLLNSLVDNALAMGLKQLTVEASITARPFFEHHGFVVIKKKTDAILRGQRFCIFDMRRLL
ncbi:GNAT family N-acetyltransferase [Klebsiella michiganensis]|uniref:GNAT family N-acetyltransferase n=1 Tax=Klebsiella michiganensis TaxID=1134687 RepID=UPI0032D9D9DF